MKNRNKTAIIIALSFFMLLCGKTYDIPVLAQEFSQTREVIPLGNSIGVTLTMDGVEVVNVSEMVNTSGKAVSPAKDAGLMPGDLIKSVNGNELHTVDELRSELEKCKNSPVMVRVLRKDGETDLTVTPECDGSNGEYKLAAWVKDSASGIGTLTFCESDSRMYGALGHSISDGATGEPVTLSSGNVLRSTIVSVERGERGRPGELKGVFMEENDEIGDVLSNSVCGLFGQLESDSPLLQKTPVPIAKRSEVKPGNAVILSNIEGESVEEYSIEIQKVNKDDLQAHKDMVIKVTDPKLLEKTGGIVQGMSGSPIIQDGKIVGAVTHVFVGDPTRGYGVYIECMLDELNKVK